MTDSLNILPKDKPLPENLDESTRSNSELNPSPISLNVTNSTNDINAKISHLKLSLEQNKLGCDIKWSLFVAACQSYRVSSCLRPFPPMFMKEGQRDITAVTECMSQMQHLPSIFHKHTSGILPSEKLHPLIHLLHWLLRESLPCLEKVPCHQYKSILELVSSESNVAKPDFIFEVCYGASSIESNWRKLIAQSKQRILHAYHGSRLENFHSILHFGLQQHFNKNSLFGQGIYLAATLSVCLIFSPFSGGWKGSSLGSEISVVALCSVLDDPEQVKCQEDTEEKKRRALAQDSLGGEVPHKYYVVENSDLVKVKYILVYSRYKASATTRQRLEPIHPLLAWLSHNKFLVLLAAYLLLLVCIGLSGNVTFLRYYRLCMNKLYQILGGNLT